MLTGTGGTATVCCSLFSSSDALRATSCGLFGWKFDYMGMVQCLDLQSLIFPQRRKGKPYNPGIFSSLESYCFVLLCFSGHQPLVLNLPSYLSVLQATAVTGWLTRYFHWCSSDTHVMGVTIYVLIGSKASCLKQNLYLALSMGPRPCG